MLNTGRAFRLAVHTRIEECAVDDQLTPAVEQIQQGARAGKHIFVEKPIASDRRGARAAIRVAQDAGVVLAVGFNRRSLAPFWHMATLH